MYEHFVNSKKLLNSKLIESTLTKSLWGAHELLDRYNVRASEFKLDFDLTSLASKNDRNHIFTGIFYERLFILEVFGLLILMFLPRTATEV